MVVRAVVRAAAAKAAVKVVAARAAAVGVAAKVAALQAALRVGQRETAWRAVVWAVAAVPMAVWKAAETRNTLHSRGNW